MKKLFIFAAVVFFASVVAVNSQQAYNVCKFTLNWDAPGYLANEECGSLPEFPLTPAQQEALEYIVEWRKQGTTPWSSYRGQVKPYTVEGLTCGEVTYELRVTAARPGDEGLCPTDIITGITKPLPPPGTCTNFRVVGNTY